MRASIIPPRNSCAKLAREQPSYDCNRDAFMHMCTGGPASVVLFIYSRVKGPGVFTVGILARWSRWTFEDICGVMLYRAES